MPVMNSYHHPSGTTRPPKTNAEREGQRYRDTSTRSRSLPPSFLLSLPPSLPPYMTSTEARDVSNAS